MVAELIIVFPNLEFRVHLSLKIRSQIYRKVYKFIDYEFIEKRQVIHKLLLP